jgi:DNA invertase Pin-like site-specific DNA recombinase
MVVSSKEKKELVIKLIEQGDPQKEIAKQAHLSLSTITKIRKELEGDTSENNKSYYLFHPNLLNYLKNIKLSFKLQ